MTMIKLIDIAFSGLPQFCGVMMILGLFCATIISVADSIATAFKKKP